MTRRSENLKTSIFILCIVVFVLADLKLAKIASTNFPNSPAFIQSNPPQMSIKAYICILFVLFMAGCLFTNLMTTGSLMVEVIENSFLI